MFDAQTLHAPKPSFKHDSRVRVEEGLEGCGRVYYTLFWDARALGKDPSEESLSCKGTLEGCP